MQYCICASQFLVVLHHLTQSRFGISNLESSLTQCRFSLSWPTALSPQLQAHPLVCHFLSLPFHHPRHPHCTCHLMVPCLVVHSLCTVHPLALLVSRHSISLAWRKLAPCQLALCHHSPLLALILASISRHWPSSLRQPALLSFWRLLLSSIAHTAGLDFLCCKSACPSPFIHRSPVSPPSLLAKPQSILQSRHCNIVP